MEAHFDYKPGDLDVNSTILHRVVAWLGGWRRDGEFLSRKRRANDPDLRGTDLGRTDGEVISARSAKIAVAIDRGQITNVWPGTEFEAVVAPEWATPLRRL